MGTCTRWEAARLLEIDSYHVVDRKHDTNIKGKGIFTFHACDRLRLCRAGCINYSFLGRRRQLKLRRYHACIGSHNCNHVRRRRLKPQRPISVSVYHSKHRLIRNQYASPIGGTTSTSSTVLTIGPLFKISVPLYRLYS